MLDISFQLETWLHLAGKEPHYKLHSALSYIHERKNYLQKRYPEMEEKVLEDKFLNRYYVYADRIAKEILTKEREEIVKEFN